MADSPLLKRLRQRARSLGARAVDELLASEVRGDALGSAVRRVQDSRRFLDENAGRMLGAVGIATQGDLERVGRKIGKLRKRLQGLVDRFED